MRNLLILGLAMLISAQAEGQKETNTLDRVSHSSTFNFVERNGTCVRGTVSEANAKTVTVDSLGKTSITFQKGDLLQVSQGNALLYSVRSSWADVSSSAAAISAREAFVLTLKNGRKVRGRPKKTTPDSITLKHGFSTTRFYKV